MSYDYNVERLRCDSCGRFMKEEIGSSWKFVPCSDVSYEENVIQCKLCTEKYGVPEPSQRVVRELCCGIIGDKEAP